MRNSNEKERRHLPVTSLSTTSLREGCCFCSHLFHNLLLVLFLLLAGSSLSSGLGEAVSARETRVSHYHNMDNTNLRAGRRKKEPLIYRDHPSVITNSIASTNDQALLSLTRHENGAVGYSQHKFRELWPFSSHNDEQAEEATIAPEIEEVTNNPTKFGEHYTTPVPEFEATGEPTEEVTEESLVGQMHSNETEYDTWDDIEQETSERIGAPPIYSQHTVASQEGTLPSLSSHSEQISPTSSASTQALASFEGAQTVSSPTYTTTSSTQATSFEGAQTASSPSYTTTSSTQATSSAYAPMSATTASTPSNYVTSQNGTDEVDQKQSLNHSHKHKHIHSYSTEGSTQSEEQPSLHQAIITPPTNQQQELNIQNSQEQGNFGIVSNTSPQEPTQAQSHMETFEELEEESEFHDEEEPLTEPEGEIQSFQSKSTVSSLTEESEESIAQLESESEFHSEDPASALGNTEESSSTDQQEKQNEDMQQSSSEDDIMSSAEEKKILEKHHIVDPNDLDGNGLNDALEAELVQEEKQAKLFGGFGVLFSFLAMIFTAHQMAENPDGLYASCCRLILTIVGCGCKIVFMPFRPYFGGHRHYGQIPMDYTYREHYRSNGGHMELS